MANEFISTSGTRAPEASRSASTWRAIRSRNVEPSRASSSDFARVMPMLVPRPPLSFSTTAWSSSSRPPASGQRVGVGHRLDRLDLVLADQPGVARRQPPVQLRERLDRGVRDARAAHLLDARFEPRRAHRCQLVR